MAEKMRDADELMASGIGVINRAYLAGAYSMRPLFSGGHDSLCATWLASQHKAFKGDVYHIDTGIGSAYTRQFVERCCEKYKWRLNVYRSPETYEKFVRERGFPGPGRHQWVYVRIKERCVRELTSGKSWKMLVTGCRSDESVRRMGHVEPVKFGEIDKHENKINRKRIWVAPCHDWTKAEQMLFMDEVGLPVNKLKIALGMSGECFCGAFAHPGELEAIRKHAPDVAEEIDRLAIVAAECGKPCRWGERPAGVTKIKSTGELCSGCDRRMAASGVIVESK